MRRLKIEKMTGKALNWAVAQVEYPGKEMMSHYNASSNWSIAGPIIEREEISISQEGEGVWIAGRFNGVVCAMAHGGSTPLIAAMRCHVASKLGDNVDIPEDML